MLVPFALPCYALADKEFSEPFESAGALVASDFGNMGRCVLLFTKVQSAVDAGRKLGHEYVVEIGNEALLMLVLDAEKGYGAINVSVDLVRTADGQTACSFLSIVSLLEAIRHTPGMGDGSS